MGCAKTYEENRQAVVIVVSLHPEILFHPRQARIANVGPVEERQEIQQAEPRDQPQVHLPHQFAVLYFAKELSVTVAWGSKLKKG